jgi:hypothetical protein
MPHWWLATPASNLPRGGRQDRRRCGHDSRRRRGVGGPAPGAASPPGAYRTGQRVHQGLSRPALGESSAIEARTPSCRDHRPVAPARIGAVRRHGGRCRGYAVTVRTGCSLGLAGPFSNRPARSAGASGPCRPHGRSSSRACRRSCPSRPRRWPSAVGCRWQCRVDTIDQWRAEQPLAWIGGRSIVLPELERFLRRGQMRQHRDGRCPRDDVHQDKHHRERPPFTLDQPESERHIW